MTNLQLYILVGIPLVGILINTALYVYLGGRSETRFAFIDTRLSLILDKLSDIDTRVSFL